VADTGIQGNTGTTMIYPIEIAVDVHSNIYEGGPGIWFGPRFRGKSLY
jgi:hypothetical protein